MAGACPRGLTLKADRRALEQILSNLIDNAINTPRRERRSRFRPVQRDDEIAISVADTGPGIAAKHLPRLFERFYRVDRGRSRDVGGTGLGLSIVKHLTEALGGHVMVESLPGVGSTFTVHLPANSAGQAPAPQESRTRMPGYHTSRDFESELRELRAHLLAMGARCERSVQLALKAFIEGSAELIAEVK